MIRIAAVADVHFGPDSRGTLREHFQAATDHADVLLVAGDLTRHGLADEAAVFAEEVAGIDVPVVVVLGNHDYHSDQERDIRTAMEGAGATVLEGEATTIEVNGDRVGIAGTKGFGGGFVGACASDFGEPEMKGFVQTTKAYAARLTEVLKSLDADWRVALLHYSPVEETLAGERLEIYPFLGSYLLAEAIDSAGADLVFHGHAHGGREKGATAAGVPVRNVAQPVIRRPYGIYCLGSDDC
ncbi:MAG TPA: metallophosphoesterase [Actinomycetota bacterium]|nr:metallophosphoesterase [Actinomycetota bacterium]